MGGLIFNGLFATLLVYLYAYIGELQYNQVGGETLGPVTFPRLLIIVILIGLAIVTVRDAVNMKKAAASEDREEKPKIAKEDIIRLALFAVSMVAYLLLLPKIGFIVDTMVLVFTIISIIGYKKPLVALIVAVGLSLLVSFVFGGFFSVALPRGVGFFRELSLYIY